MGVDPDDCRKVSQLIGVKTFLNEFVAYGELSVFINNKVSFDEHLNMNGTFRYDGDDIILEGTNTTLTGGILQVSFVSALT